MMKRYVFILMCVFLLVLGTACKKNTPLEDCHFDFDYKISNASPQRESAFSITTELINVADKTYYVWYVSSSSVPTPTAEATLYTIVNGSEQVIVPQDRAMNSDVVEKQIAMKPGEKYEFCVSYCLPADAPSGIYHLKLTYLGQEKVFEDVFSLDVLE